MCERYVCEGVVGERAGCERCAVTKLCLKEFFLTELCVKELCVTKLCEKALCERERVGEAGGRDRRSEDGSAQEKNKNPTQSCGEKPRSWTPKNAAEHGRTTLRAFPSPSAGIAEPTQGLSVWQHHWNVEDAPRSVRDGAATCMACHKGRAAAPGLPGIHFTRDSWFLDSYFRGFWACI